MNVQKFAWTAAMLGVVTWGAAYGAERDEEAGVRAKADAAAATGKFCRASELIGMEVRGAGDADLGEVQDLLIDSETHEIEYLVLDSGLFADLDGTMTVIPWVIVDTQREADSDDYFISLSLTEERVKSAPQIDPDEADLLAGSTWVEKVNQYFDEEIEQRRVARPDLGDDEANPDRNRPEQRRPTERPNQPKPKDRRDQPNP